MSVWYLDLDDEITDAVARLRAAKDDKVVLVLPPGSRIGTGRINFRLLAREAETRGLTLAMVSSDAQVRALAQSAGLTSHLTVGDAERTLGLDVDDDSPTGARSTTAATIPPSSRVSDALSTTAEAATATSAGRLGGMLHRRREGYSVTPRTATAASGEVALTVATHGAGEGARVVRRGPSTRRRIATWGMRGAMIGALGATVLYVAYLTLPTATVTLVPGSTQLDPVAVSIVAGPNTPVADGAAGVIPAKWYPIPLSQSGTFDATGRNEELTYARGKVVFTSKNTLTPVTIPEGTRVSTVDGRDYKTLTQAVLPEWSGDTGGPRPSVEVAVQASRRGPDGTAGRDAVSVVPKRLDLQRVSVTNPDRIEGGDRSIRKVVTKKDCEAARQELLAQVTTGLAAEAAKAGTPGLERYPASASLGTPELTPACEDLVGQTADTFDLTAKTIGTVLEVDETLLEPTARDHFQLAQGPSTQIEPGSIVASRDGEPVVAPDSITFPMAVTARVTLLWDAATILQDIAGAPVAAARDTLSAYGEATLVMWPDFVPNLPTDTNRITLVIEQD